MVKPEHVACEIESCMRQHNECGHAFFDPCGCYGCAYEGWEKEWEKESKENLALLDDAVKALRCIWAGVPDKIRADLATHSLPANQAVAVFALPLGLTKVSEVLAKAMQLGVKP